MQAVENIARAFERLQSDLPKIFVDVMRDNAAYIEDLNISQLEQGIDSEGQRITPPYSVITKQIKRAKRQPYDRVTLKDTGDFHRSLFLTGGRDAFFQIGSSDDKAEKLQRKYGKDILGLNEQSRQEVIEEILLPEMLIKIRQQLQI